MWYRCIGCREVIKGWGGVVWEYERLGGQGLGGVV